MQPAAGALATKGRTRVAASGLREDFDMTLSPWAFLLVGVAWLVLRAPGLLVAPRFWAEESAFVSAATRLDGLAPLGFVYWRAGYASWPANLGAWLGVTLLPLEWAPLATTLLALLIQLAPFAAVLFLRFDFPVSRSQRRIAAVALLTATTSSQGIAWLNTISAQMHLGLLAAVLLFASARQANRRASGALVLALLLAGLGGPYALFLLPVFAGVAWAERDGWRVRQTLALALAFAVQLAIVLYKRFGLALVNEKRGLGTLSPEAIELGLRESVALPLFGQRAVIGAPPFADLLLGLSLAAVALAACVLVEAARAGEARTTGAALVRRLARVELRGFFAWLCCVGAIAFTAFDGVPAGRYAVVPGGLTLMIVMLAAQRARPGIPRRLLAGVVGVAIATGVWNPRQPEALECDGNSSGWQAAARGRLRDTVVRLPVCPPGWTVKIHPDRTVEGSRAEP